jgi:outer membrane biosynthesis protein TonB
MNKTTKVLGTLTLATLLVTGVTSPVYAEDILAAEAVSSTSQEAIVAEDATLTFDSTSVTTAPASVVEEVVPTEEVPVVPVVTPVPIETPQEPAQEEVPIVKEVIPTPPVQEQPSVPEVPIVVPEPQPEVVEVPIAPVVEVVDWSSEALKGMALAQEGERYFGSFSSEVDIWTADGYRVVLSDATYATPVYHVFEAVVAPTSAK